MLSIVKITTILELFLAFNYVEGSDSLNFEHSDYDDKFFRWTNESFSHQERYCIIFNNISIKMFDAVKVRDRLGANRDKIKSSPDNKNFGCNIDVVKDLVHVIPIEILTDKEIKEIKAHKKLIIDAAKLGAKELLKKQQTKTYG